MTDNTPVLNLDGASVPAQRQIARRTNPFLQLMRFIVLNVKMIRVIAKGHH